MNAKLIALIVTSLLPSIAGAGLLDLEQDLGGLDLTVTLVPVNSPDAMRIDNKTEKTVSCSASFTGAEKQRTVTVTIEPGKSATVRIPGSNSDMPRTGELKCEEHKQSK
jgi:hypothetical protein